MSKKANPTVIGGFVLGAIALSIYTVVLLGGGNLFQERLEVVVYFDESIQGLDLGAPVEFEGFRIGTVSSVRMEMGTGEDAGRIFRPVVFDIELSRIHFQGYKIRRGKELYEALEEMVQNNGLRARLATQSLLTGRSKIELFYQPGSPVRRQERNTGIWEIPSMPSPIAAARQELMELPLSEIVMETHLAIKRINEFLGPEKAGASIEALNQTLLSFQETLSPERTGQTVANLNQTLAQMSLAIENVNQSLETLTGETIGTLQETRKTIQEAQAVLAGIGEGVPPLFATLNNTARSIDEALDPENPKAGDLLDLLDEIRRTSRAIRLLVEFLEQQPESLLWGR